jgi:hypothetical protein
MTPYNRFATTPFCCQPVIDSKTAYIFGCIFLGARPGMLRADRATVTTGHGVLLAPHTVHESISQRELDPLTCSPGSAGEELLVPNCNRDCNRVETCKQPDQRICRSHEVGRAGLEPATGRL